MRLSFKRNKQRVEPTPLRGWDVDPDQLVAAHSREDLTFATLMGIAARAGKESGYQAARGKHFSDTIEGLPSRHLLAEKVGERKKFIERSGMLAQEQVKSQILGLEAKEKGANERQRQSAGIEQNEKARLETHEQGISDGDNPHPPNRLAIGYWLLLAVLAMVEFPTIYQSLQGSILDQWAVYLITGALSIVVAMCAHIVGTNLARYLEENRALRGSQVIGAESVADTKVDRNVHLTIVVVITFMMISLMVAMFETRSSLFAGLVETRKQNGLRSAGFNVDLLSTTFFVLQVLLFVLATAVSFNRSKHEEDRVEAKRDRKRKRELEKETAKAERDAKEHIHEYQEILSSLEQARNSSALIERSMRSRLEQEDHFMRALYAEHDLAYESAKRETATALPPDPALFEAVPASEFRTIEVKP